MKPIISPSRGKDTRFVLKGATEGRNWGLQAEVSFLAAPAMVAEGSGPECGTSYGSHTVLLEIPPGDGCFTRP